MIAKLSDTFARVERTLVQDALGLGALVVMLVVGLHLPALI